MKKKLLLQVFDGENISVPPVWLMRQAGRYLPEYRETRKNAGGFLDLCYNSDLATEVTLQPIRRFGFDAAILFADILLLPQALGMNVWFEPGEGPRLHGLNDSFDINQLREIDQIHEKLMPIYTTIENLKSQLPKETTLIGFAGAPWTVATYMINGRGSTDQQDAKIYMYKNKLSFERLLNIITKATIEYLSKQIESGAEVVKLFDSWAGSLSGDTFLKYSIEPAIEIAIELKKRYPNIKLISFPRGAGPRYKDFVIPKVFDGLAIDNYVPLKWIKTELQPFLPVQGNLDPVLLVTGGDPLKRQCNEILNELNGKNFIFNLGHGITPNADPKNVELLLRYIRG